MVEYQRDFLSTNNIDDVQSHYLQNLIATRDGVIDDHLQALLHLEKYIMHRELETGQPFDPADLDEIRRVAAERVKDFDMLINIGGSGWIRPHIE